MRWEKYIMLMCMIMVGTSLSAQLNVNPNHVLVNRENSISGAEVFGINRNVSGFDLYGGMYAATNGSFSGRPFYGYSVNNVVNAYTYYDGADDGLHSYLGGLRQSIWRDSMQWQTMDGSILRYNGYKLSLGNNGNLIVGYQTVLNDSPSNIGNTILGSLSAQNLMSGVSNTIVGNWSSWKLTTGDFNTTLGSYTGADLTTGSRNTMVGYYAGSNTATNSTGNVFLGYRAGEDEQGSDKLYIANSETTTPLIYGDFATSSLEINGSTEISGATTIEGLTTINAQVHSEDINIKDNNPYLQFYQYNSPKFYFQYQNSNDQFVFVEVGNGQVLKFKDGEVYLPQLANGGLRPLSVDNDGKLTTDLPSPLEFTGLEFHANGSGSTQYIILKKLQDGMTINSMECVVHCFGNPVGSIYLSRYPKTPSSGNPETIFTINPPGDGCGTWSTSTVVTAGSNVIDTDAYHYFLSTLESDSQEYSQILLHH